MSSSTIVSLPDQSLARIPRMNFISKEKGILSWLLTGPIAGIFPGFNGSFRHPSSHHFDCDFVRYPTLDHACVSMA